MLETYNELEILREKALAFDSVKLYNQLWYVGYGVKIELLEILAGYELCGEINDLLIMTILAISVINVIKIDVKNREALFISEVNYKIKFINNRHNFICIVYLC